MICLFVNLLFFINRHLMTDTHINCGSLGEQLSPESSVQVSQSSAASW